MTVEERFLRYVAFETTSDEESEATPSTACQLLLADHLAEELRALGLENVHRDEYGRVYGHLPASPGCEEETCIGLIAHMDTSPAVSGANIKPRFVQYAGGDIELGNGVVTRVSDFPFLKDYEGQQLIVTDGTTLLGADDKAGVAEIVSAAEYLLAHPEIKHGRLAIAFTPDEEVGRGPEHFDIPGFGAEYAYTVDGGTLGELEYENFNAAAIKVTVHGVNIHPGSAKNKMKNAVLIAGEFMSLLPPAETPAHTEGYEGFYHAGDIAGNETLTKIGYILRDHDEAKLEEKKRTMQRAADFLNERYGEGTIELMIRDQYRNMKEKILPVMHVIRRAEDAMRKAGVEPKTVPIRGGTDGAQLSFMGLPCPNLSTGGENFHGIHEFVSVDAMKKMVEVLVNLVTA